MTDAMPNYWTGAMGSGSSPLSAYVRDHMVWQQAQATQAPFLFPSERQTPMSTMLAITAMLTTMKDLPLPGNSLEALVLLDELATLLAQGLTRRGLDADWLPRRQRAIKKAIHDAIDAEMDRLDAEDERLKEKEQQRADLAARKAQLARALQYPESIP